MKIMEAIDRNPTLTGQLLEVWESSVKATHLFLSEEEIENIKNYVPQAIQEIPYLIIAVNEHQVPVGFMGIAEQHLEMLFISDEERGKGLSLIHIIATSTTSAKPSSFNAPFTFSGVTVGPNWPTKAGAIAAITSLPDFIA